MQTFGTAAACAGLLEACAHAGGPTRFAAVFAPQTSFGALGEDLPAGALGSAADPPATLPTRKMLRKAALRTASIDTPVGSLCGRPAARALIDRDLPGLTTWPEYAFFKHMTLRQLQAASLGQMTRESLARVSRDLEAVPPDPASEPSAPFGRKREAGAVRKVTRMIANGRCGDA